MSSGHQEAGTVYDIVWILGSLACLGSPRNRVSVQFIGVSVYTLKAHTHLLSSVFIRSSFGIRIVLLDAFFVLSSVVWDALPERNFGLADFLNEIFFGQ